MSHHKHGYMIHPDSNHKCPVEQWKKADLWIAGNAYKGDFEEAKALAKIGVLSYGVPFVVAKVPLGGIKPEFVDSWIIY